MTFDVEFCIIMVNEVKILRQMMLLLVEDENQSRVDFKDYIQTLRPALSYPVSFYMAKGESEALSLVQKFDFDNIILDLELDESDGDGIAFMEKFNQLKPTQKPYIVVTTNNRSPITKDAARKAGADYIFWKKKPDYSPKLVMEHICIVYQSKIKSCQTSPVTTVKKLSLHDEIKVKISKIGINADLLGRNYVVESILNVIKSNNPNIKLHKDVYPLIAKKYKVTVESVNRAIETALNKAWIITDYNTLAEHYPLSVGGSKGAPTPKEFVLNVANFMREETNIICS